jgi:glyoxylase-like metal-dependent hydrolase (beta-lactamase superfamily II)
VARVSTATDDRLYFRQLLGGRDFADDDAFARQMVNFAYLIGDRSTGECLVVDPAYRVADLVDAAEADDMRITGVLVTHYHADHVGGSLFGHEIEGIAALLATHDVPIHVNEHEAPWVERTTGVGSDHLRVCSSGDVLRIGSIDVTCIHTPGHTPGSQCFLVQGGLVSGDTLFLDGCGRTDLPGSDPGAMYESLVRLAELPDSTVVLPGHMYSSSPAAPLGEVKQHNFVYRPRTREQWLTMFGAG